MKLDPATAGVTLLSLLVLVGCRDVKPLPERKLDYEGSWKAPGVELMITKQGGVSYDRTLPGGGIETVYGPIRRWDGDDFIVGYPFATTRVEVTVVPHQIDGEWRMTVDGIEVTR